ncbi:iron siderophore-binding protein [Halobacillus halophilus]|uniref:ABC-type transport system extracellular binding protein (Probable substrate iron complex) n=1 Tax=Halobacillus halophilus (strain ATCC 35676 / DSM 2266 / JCM 20832 / KCTC 3685 / LMG 17431 / NBRC 102448 / NCIMB 2269) TaxID=866895 RepID=I0JMC8_HALH3|nr:iron-siderophore ABC transporter substrate-binding protein [Halobacillus halophilus]ASF39384.1 iron siderophore-binding protein [Halobacillus halophilus]CCG45298.1 ABC-type transport system extracellular binding protein (probable substrate iron complex) [Halobacillus halophilus DSM 2266]
MLKRFLAPLALLMVLSLVLSACGNSSSEEDTTQDSEDNSNDSGSENFEPYTIEHAMGETTVEEKPERVVILTNEGTEALLAMDVKPVGAVKSWTGDPWYDHISDQMEGVEVVGDESNVNIEKILELEPDLIIGNKQRQEDIYEKLNKIAPTIFSEKLRGEWQSNFMTYAEALNMEDKGQQLIDEYDQRLQDFADQAGDKLNQKVSVIRFLPDHVRIYHKDSFSGVILEQIGFERPESQDVNDFMEKATKERIPAMDGDVLFYFTYETGDGAASNLQEEWLNDPLFQNLDVVKSGDVHEVSDAIWNTAGGYIAANEMVDDLEKYFLENEE